MISMAPVLPPPVTLTDEAMKLAAALLQIASDAAGTKARMDELSAATAALRAAIDEHAAAKTQAKLPRPHLLMLNGGHRSWPPGKTRSFASKAGSRPLRRRLRIGIKL